MVRIIIMTKAEFYGRQVVVALCPSHELHHLIFTFFFFLLFYLQGLVELFGYNFVMEKSDKSIHTFPKNNISEI